MRIETPYLSAGKAAGLAGQLAACTDVNYHRDLCEVPFRCAGAPASPAGSLSSR